MPLYYQPGQIPAPLPFRIILSDGSTRTATTPFTSDEIADAGFSAAPDQPPFNPQSHTCTWDFETLDWVVAEIPPPPPVPHAPPPPITQLAAKQLFTTAERIAIRQSADPVVADFMDLLNSAQEVHLDNPAFIAGVQYLATVALLTEGRAGDILSGNPPA